MHPIDKTEWEILNATADDWENLEQIYLAVCCNVPVAIPQEQYGLVYAKKHDPRMRDVADGIVRLVEAGLLEARGEGIDEPVSDRKDRSFVWRAWFSMTPQGRKLWESSDYMVEKE